MVNDQRDRYLGGSEGAPPVPPPGGYKGARRAASGAHFPGMPEAVSYTAPEPAGHKKGSGPLAHTALWSAAVFIVVLLITLGSGGADTLYGPTMLVLQLLVLGVIIAALFAKRGRMLAGIALAATLILNISTVGAMGAVIASATQNYDGTKSDEQRHAEAYPGVRDLSASEVLGRDSLETVQDQGERIMADIRARITEEFGYTWVQSGSEDISPERNGHGGESMLRRYTSATWTTEQPVHGLEHKREVMEVIDRVLWEHGMWGLYSFNEMDAGISPDMLAKLYGSTDPARQHTWEYYSDTYPDPLRFYAVAYDLTNDPTGDFLLQRQAIHDQTGEPLEGIQLLITGRQLLSEADREEFQTRMRDYSGF